MPLLKIIVLAIVQGLAEVLPVSSSAHVVVAEKLLGLDPVLAADDAAARHAAYRHDDRGHRVLLAAVAPRLVLERGRVAALSPRSW